MTLAFSEKINGSLTFFTTKILNGLVNNELIKVSDYRAYSAQLEKKNTPVIFCVANKIHTIREDKTNRWKAGNLIHFVINNRTKKRYQFAPIIKCVSIQILFFEYI